MNKISVKDLELSGKKVILRADFNVPLDDNGNITDEARLRAALPTIEYILSRNPKKLILMSHLGRPKGKVVESLRMGPVAGRLEKLLGEKVLKLNDCVGDEVKNAIDTFSGKIVLLENLRFYVEETKGEEDFAKSLASLADVYVNDAFGTAHRAHASTTVIAKFIPGCVGFLMEKEIENLTKVAVSPAKPFTAILGGAKVSDKIGVINSLLEKVDSIIIGGAMSYTFLKAQGLSIGASRCENDKLDLAKEILDKASSGGVNIVLPNDHLIVDAIDNPSSAKITEGVEIEDGFLGVDVGPKSIDNFKSVLEKSKTVLWNGPLGIFEKDPYAKGTKEIALFLAGLDAVVIVGGGDSASAAKKFGVAQELSWVSTGGGASLEFLEGKELPALSAIPNKE